MAALQLGAPLALKTSSIGWPVELNIYKIRDDVYFDVTVTLEYLGLQKHVKNMALVLLTSFFLRMAFKTALCSTKISAIQNLLDMQHL